MTERIVRLRAEHRGDDVRHLWAYVDNAGSLHIDGHDLGPGTRPVSADGEYEWFTTIEAAHVETLVAALGGRAGDDVLDLLEAGFTGDASYELERVVRESGIPVQRFVPRRARFALIGWGLKSTRAAPIQRRRGWDWRAGCCADVTDGLAVRPGPEEPRDAGPLPDLFTVVAVVEGFVGLIDRKDGVIPPHVVRRIRAVEEARANDLLTPAAWASALFKIVDRPR